MRREIFSKINAICLLPIIRQKNRSAQYQKKPVNPKRMAEDKKSFVAYADWKNVFELLDDAEAGKLIKHLLRYVNDENPELDDRMLKIIFEPIKMQLKRDLVKWNGGKEIKSNSGILGNLKRWNNDLYLKVVSKEMTIEQAQIIAKDRTATKDIANVAVNDNVTVTVNVNEEKGFSLSPKIENEIQYTIEHCLTIALNDNRWVQANKATRNDLEAFNKKLEGRGIYKKNPADYKTHFHNWKAGGMKDKDIPEVSQVIANRDQKAKNFLNSIN